MDISEIPADEQRRRIRAAIGYSGREARKVAEDLGVSPATLTRRSSGKGAKSIDELHRIAKLCGVPEAFMEEGFTRFQREDSAVEQRLERLERRLDVLATKPAATEVPGPPGELGRVLSGEQPTGPDQSQTANHSGGETG